MGIAGALELAYVEKKPITKCILSHLLDREIEKQIPEHICFSPKLYFSKL